MQTILVPCSLSVTVPAALELSTVAAAGAGLGAGAGAGPGAGAGADMVERENRADGRSICEMEFVVGIRKAEETERRTSKAFLELERRTSKAFLELL